MVLIRRLREDGHAPALGSTPTIPAARPQGSLPTLKMPTARGWSRDTEPGCGSGTKVNAFATGLKHPRWIEVAAETATYSWPRHWVLPAPATSLFDYAMLSTMKRAAAVGVSPNRITRLRDADGDGSQTSRRCFWMG